MNHEDAFSEEETRLGQAASKVADTKVALKQRRIKERKRR